MEMDAKNVSVSNKKNSNANFCVQLSQELKECNKKYKSSDDDVCNYFNLVFQMKCIGIGGIKMNNLDKNE